MSEIPETGFQTSEQRHLLNFETLLRAKQKLLAILSSARL